MGGLLKIERTAPFDNFSEPVTNAARDYAHPSGTTRMGTQKTTSVVDPQLRCHDLPNLRIVSASVFPTAGSANPALTIMQLALYCADLLIRDVG
jgi:choline dehydrogenase-like flavoprotein